jgi:hypothetical protein
MDDPGKAKKDKDHQRVRIRWWVILIWVIVIIHLIYLFGCTRRVNVCIVAAPQQEAAAMQDTRLSVRTDPDFLLLVKETAAKRQMTLAAFVRRALVEAIAKGAK